MGVFKQQTLLEEGPLDTSIGRGKPRSQRRFATQVRGHFIDSRVLLVFRMAAIIISLVLRWSPVLLRPIPR